ncbi:MAG TPA: hypothetical protein VEX68_23045 [Bryobacteraceae bacterium]|nr:hypothetical protein [Bryobacteraceae bacterium]
MKVLDSITDSTGALLPDDDAHREARRILSETLDAALGHTPESLVRTQELGTAQDFTEIKPIIIVLQAYLRLLQEANQYAWIGPKRLKMLGELASGVNNLFREMKGYQSGNHNEHLSLVQRSRHLWDELSINYSPHLGFLAAMSETLQSLPERINNDLKLAKQSMADEVQKVTAPVSEKLTQVDAALDRAKQAEVSMRSAAEDAGITAQARFFEKEARTHEQTARIWLAALVVIGLAAACYIFFLLEPQLLSFARATHAENDPVHVTIAFAVSRLAVLSLMWFIVLLCSRQFNAHRHNAVVNRHRHNAISTFRAFAEGTQGDAVTRNAILLSATQSVFAPQSTGYLKGDGDSPQSPANQIIEVFRGIAPTKDKQ